MSLGVTYLPPSKEITKHTCYRLVKDSYLTASIHDFPPLGADSILKEEYYLVGMLHQAGTLVFNQ